MRPPVVALAVLIAGLALSLFFLRAIMLPFALGMAVAYILDPAVRALERRRLSRAAATGLLTAAFFLTFIGAGAALTPLLQSQLVRLAANAPDYALAVQGAMAPILERLGERLGPEEMERINAALRGNASQALDVGLGFLARLLSGGGALLNLVSLLVVTPVVAFYMLRDWPRIVAYVEGWIPRSLSPTVSRLRGDIDRRLAGFLRGQALVCLAMAVYYAGGLSLASLDFALVIGVAAGLLTFIPLLGALLGFAGAMGVAFFQFPWSEWTSIALVAGVFFLGQALEGYVLTPRLVGARVGLHPAWIIFALLAGGALLGFLGLLLAVPLAAIIAVLLRFAREKYRECDAYRAPPKDDA